MVFALSWLPDVLEAAGLKVAEVPGWRTRGRGEMGQVRGVICHHTAGPRPGNMPSLDVLIRGRLTGPKKLPGPLAQLGLGRDGTYYVVAAGRANHAGEGKWEGLSSGNSNFIGIEAENSGDKTDAWPEVQIDAYCRGAAAILSHVGSSHRMCCGHREYALPPGRKPDPLLNMNEFRQRVVAFMTGTAKPLLIPAIDDRERLTVRRGDHGDLVREIQRSLGITPEDGIFGAVTETRVREFQRLRGVVPDGIVGPKTWAQLDRGT